MFEGSHEAVGRSEGLNRLGSVFLTGLSLLVSPGRDLSTEVHSSLSSHSETVRRVLSGAERKGWGHASLSWWGGLLGWR